MAAEYLALMGERIRQRRDEMGLSRADLARLLPGKTNENQVYRWEKGLHQPNPDTLEALARVLECDVAHFMAPAPQKPATPSPFNGNTPDVLERLASIEAKLDQLLGERDAARERMAQLAPEDVEDALNMLRRLETLEGRAARDVGRRDVEVRHAKDRHRGRAADAA